MQLLTKHQKKLITRNKAIFKYYEELKADSENSPKIIEDKIMKKFGLKSRSSVWVILKKKQEEAQLPTPAPSID